MKNPIKTILYCVLLSIGCNRHKDVYEKFDNQFPKFKIERFSVRQITEMNWYTDYLLYTPDSNACLYFAYFNKSIENREQGSIVFVSYQQKEIEEDTVSVSGFDENNRLLYSFKHVSNKYVPDEHAVFLKGKYYYYYTYLRSDLNKYQRGYFESNKDSITINLINEIPGKIEE